MSVAIAQFTGDTTYSYGYSGTQQAQTFPVPAGYTYIDYFNLELVRLGTVSGSVTASLYETSGNLPTGSALASASVTASTITTSAAGAWYTFDFGNVAVSAGGQYAVVISHGGTSSSNTIAWRCSGSDAYADGRGCYKYSGGSWAAYSSYVRDFSFYVYGYGVPTGMGATTTSSVTNTSMTAASDVTGDAGSTITSKGFCYSSVTSNPTLADSYKVVGSGTGAYSASITGLSAGTTYYIRSYATNAADTSYGAVKTQATTYSAPSVTTSAVTSVDKFTATFNGNVTADNGSTITERGFVYSTVTNPLIGGAGVTKQTVTGTTGAYSYNASSLSAKTTYYVKAYAINAAGTSYGSQTSFETLSAAPSVTSTGTSNLLDTTATFGGNVTADNGSAITERGVVYGISANPTTGNTKVTTSGTTGAYTCDITGLTAATTYHYRAYAINSYGTSYGADVELRTKPSKPTSLEGAVVGKTQVDLTWTKGTGGTYTIIRRATGAYPTGPGDGVDVYSGVGTSTSDTGLSAGTTYYYRAWAKDGSANYSTDTVDLTKTTDYGLTDAAEIYAEDTTYATAPANDNAIYIKLSKDGGGTWSNELSSTLPASNGVVSFGASGTELWGKTWTGDDVDDTSFRLQLTVGSNKTSYQILKNFGFTITSTYLLTGIEVRVKGYFDTDTAYLDGVSVKCYYGTSVLPVRAGAQAYDSTEESLVFYDGTVWQTLAVKETDGWLPVRETWKYASPTTITVPSGAQNIFAKGDKILITQTTDKYFFVTSVADTLLTVTGGSDYSVANATITAAFYSKAASPAKFPHWFNWAPSTSGITVGNGSLVTRFTVIGKTVHFFIRFELGSTSAITGRNYFSLPVSGAGYGTGLVFIQDTGSETFQGQAFWNTDNVFIDVVGSGATYAKQLYFSSTVPMTWVATDWYVASGTYEMYNT